MYDGVCRRLAHYAAFPSSPSITGWRPRINSPCRWRIAWPRSAGSPAWGGARHRRHPSRPRRRFGRRQSVAGRGHGLRDGGGPKLKAAALIYGAFGADPDTDSYRTYGTDQYLLSRADMIWFWNHYLRGETDKLDPRAVPLLGRFDNLPPLFVSAAEFDPLLDDSRRLVELLKAAGAPHDWAFWPGVVHGCIDMARLLEPAEGFLRDTALWIKDKLQA
jgi:Esterase/lipase